MNGTAKEVLKSINGETWRSRYSWVVLGLSLIGVAAYSGPNQGVGGSGAYVPTRANYKLLETVESCVIYRSLVRRTQTNLEQNRLNLSKQMDQLKLRREKLEDCAKQRGLGDSVDAIASNSDAETMLALMCSEQYAEWLNLGYQTEMVTHDITVAVGSVSWLNEKLNLTCPKFPAEAASNREASLPLRPTKDADRSIGAITTSSSGGTSDLSAFLAQSNLSSP